jgi:hypothetical protein
MRYYQKKYNGKFPIYEQKTLITSVNENGITNKRFHMFVRDIDNNIYTLTDVENTPIVKNYSYKEIYDYKVTESQIDSIKEKMISKFKKYYSNFEEDFSYEGYFLSDKTKQNSSSDSREVSIEELYPNLVTVNCGKICGIFDFEKYLEGI